MKEKTIETKNKQEKHIGLQTEKQIHCKLYCVAPNFADL